MKPKKLIICGWGPYKEQAVIDFTKFNTDSLFLITGQTGAGKTTIFDAIAYALFGILSGTVREKGSVRSDFADENTRTFVELDMEHKGEAYHIVRNPEYQRPKKKKSGGSTFTKEKENAALTLPDGTIIAGNQEVTRKIQELLGMDGRQFCQISMIAQGEFAKLLLASPAEKTAIFRELFGTSIYALVQSSLKERSAGLYREYMNVRNKMEEDVRILSLEDEDWKELISHEQTDFAAAESYLKDKLTAINAAAKEKQEEEKAVEEKLLHLKEELTEVRQINSRFKELEDTKGQLAVLEEKKADMQKLEEEIKAVKRAQLLSLEEKVVAEKEQAAIESEKRIRSLEKELEQCLDELKKLEGIAAKQEIIRDAYRLQDELEDVLKQIKDRKQELSEVEKKLERAREEYVASQKQAEEKHKRYEEADRLYKNAVIGIAARFVEKGKPCPVCGSLEHPKVAQISHEVPDDKQLEGMKKEAETARTVCNECYEAALHHQNEQKQLLTACGELADRQTALQTKLQQMERSITEYIHNTPQKEFEAGAAHYRENQSIAGERQKQIENAREEWKQKKEESGLARNNLNRKIIKSGFTTLDDYVQMMTRLSRLSDMENEYGEYQEKQAALRKLYEHLQEALAGLEPKEEETVSLLFMECKQQKKEIREMMDSYHILADQIKRSLLGIRENRRKAEEIQKEYGIVKDLDDLANGNNARRLVFEQFVLAGYFEQILKAANLRLLKMTDGRYELSRAGQISDGRRKDNLEILVMDYYTGKKRSVKTLSGGETFKASLALALGMSDCIQAQNGGLEVETLFIDEGFGALDEESLEQSCAVLQSLAGSNRMIGIISHVPELREQIEHQIIIEKKNFGSSVCVRV